MGQYRPLGNGKINYQNQLLLTEKKNTKQKRRLARILVWDGHWALTRNLEELLEISGSTNCKSCYCVTCT